MVYKITFATMKHQIKQAETSTAGVVVSVEAALVDHTILLDFFASKVALEEPEIGSTDPKFLIDNSCTDDKLHCKMPVGIRNYNGEGDERDECEAFPTANW